MITIKCPQARPIGGGGGGGGVGFGGGVRVYSPFRLNYLQTKQCVFKIWGC